MSGCRDKQAKAAEAWATALFSSTGHQSVRLALRQWHGVAFKERRSKEIARLREQSQARIAQQQRRIEQANLATIRYREHAFAPFFAASEEGSAKWLQIFLWDWKRAVTSSASKRILRLWRIIASMELFKCKVWLAESCIRLWACVVRVARLEASAEDHLLPIMAIQAEARLQASVEARIAAGESLLLLHTLLCAWRRFRQVEMLKLEVQRACQRWNGEERKVMQTLRDVEHSVGKVWGFAVHAMDKHHAREDLRDVLLAWAQEACYGKVETQLLAACEEAHKGPQEQRRFEAMVRERWTDRTACVSTSGTAQGVVWPATCHPGDKLRCKRPHKDVGERERSELPASLSGGWTRSASGKCSPSSMPGNWRFAPPGSSGSSRGAAGLRRSWSTAMRPGHSRQFQACRRRPSSHSGGPDCSRPRLLRRSWTLLQSYSSSPSACRDWRIRTPVSHGAFKAWFT
ncbi:unnamed protein product [Effrenium voratum]|nr:unnamed protein product [Effrenium voratum]